MTMVDTASVCTSMASMPSSNKTRNFRGNRAENTE